MTFLDRPLTSTEQAMIQAAMADDQLEAARLATVLDTEDRDMDARLTRADALADAALYYAMVLGWPVFPLRPGQKRPLTRHGFKEATTSETQVRQWWEETPDANIGLPTGQAFDVIDIDTREAITTAMRLGLPAHGDGLLAAVMTPRGWHLYIPTTGTGNRAGVIDGVDYRGRGGYVVAPPSIVGGRRYRWEITPQATVEEKAA